MADIKVGTIASKAVTVVTDGKSNAVLKTKDQPDKDIGVVLPEDATKFTPDQKKLLREQLDAYAKGATPEQIIAETPAPAAAPATGAAPAATTTPPAGGQEPAWYEKYTGTNNIIFGLIAAVIGFFAFGPVGALLGGLGGAFLTGLMGKTETPPPSSQGLFTPPATQGANPNATNPSNSQNVNLSPNAAGVNAGGTPLSVPQINIPGMATGADAIRQASNTAIREFDPVRSSIVQGLSGANAEVIRAGYEHEAEKSAVELSQYGVNPERVKNLLDIPASFNGLKPDALNTLETALNKAQATADMKNNLDKAVAASNNKVSEFYQLNTAAKSQWVLNHERETDNVIEKAKTGISPALLYVDGNWSINTLLNGGAAPAKDKLYWKASDRRIADFSSSAALITGEGWPGSINAVAGHCETLLSCDPLAINTQYEGFVKADEREPAADSLKGKKNYEVLKAFAIEGKNYAHTKSYTTSETQFQKVIEYADEMAKLDKEKGGRLLKTSTEWKFSKNSSGETVYSLAHNQADREALQKALDMAVTDAVAQNEAIDKLNRENIAKVSAIVSDINSRAKAGIVIKGAFTEGADTYLHVEQQVNGKPVSYTFKGTFADNKSDNFTLSGVAAGTITQAELDAKKGAFKQPGATQEVDLNSAGDVKNVTKEFNEERAKEAAAATLASLKDVGNAATKEAKEFGKGITSGMKETLAGLAAAVNKNANSAPQEKMAPPPGVTQLNMLGQTFEFKDGVSVAPPKTPAPIANGDPNAKMAPPPVR